MLTDSRYLHRSTTHKKETLGYVRLVERYRCGTTPILVDFTWQEVAMRLHTLHTLPQLTAHSPQPDAPCHQHRPGAVSGIGECVLGSTNHQRRGRDERHCCSLHRLDEVCNLSAHLEQRGIGAIRVRGEAAMARVSRERTTRDRTREQNRQCEGSCVGGEANGRSFTCGGVPMNLALAANEIRASIDAIVGLVNMCAFIRASFEGSAAKALIEATITAALPDSELAAAAKTAASAAFLLFHFCADASTSTRISSRCVAITAAIASIWSCPTVSRENPAAAVSTANLPRLKTYMSTAPGTAFLHLYTRHQHAIDESNAPRPQTHSTRP